MTRPSLVTTLAICSGALAATSLLTIASASAEPFDGPLIETSCSYEQLYNALQVEDPNLAAVLEGNPQAQTKLRAFIALPVDQRKQRVSERLDQNPDWQAKIDQKRATPEGQEKVAMLRRMADTCQNY